MGYSHGGNVAALVTHMIERPVNNLVTLGTPVRSDYQPNMNNVIRHTNAYSNIDFVQSPLGGKLTVGAALGIGLPPISIGLLLPQRTYDNANNIEVTRQAGLRRPHRDMPSQAVWNRIDQQILR